MGTVTVGVVSWVRGGLKGSVLGKNSLTIPTTLTRLPTAAAAGGAVEVNTKMPSEVAGLASTSASVDWRKKALAIRAVTMPSVTTAIPTIAEVEPLPWTSWMGVNAAGAAPGSGREAAVAAKPGTRSARTASSGAERGAMRREDAVRGMRSPGCAAALVWIGQVAKF